MTEKIGLVGFGRLGRALAEVLGETGQLLVIWDPDPVATRCAEERGLITAARLEEIAYICNTAMLCLPGNRVASVAEALVTAHPGIEIVGFATGADATPGPYRRARPIAQYVAISAGLPWKLLVDDQNSVDLLRGIFPARVPIVVDAITDVGLLNRELTRISLRACIEAQEVLDKLSYRNTNGLSDEVKNVIVGTVLEYSPDMTNHYVVSLLSELANDTMADGRASLFGSN